MQNSLLIVLDQRLNLVDAASHNSHIVVVYRLYKPWPRGVGHLGHDEAMEAGGREFDPRPGHYSRMSF